MPKPVEGLDKVRLICIAVIYGTAVLAFTCFGLYQHLCAAVTQPDDIVAGQSCPDPGTPTPDAPSPGTAAVVLEQRGTPVDSIAFGRAVGTQSRQFDFTVAEGQLPPQCLMVQASPFLRIGEADTAQIDPDRIHARAEVIGRQVRVTVSVTRDARFAPSGAYTGTVGIVDPRVERVDIPMTVTMSYPVWQLPLVVLLLTIPIAIGYLWLIKGSFYGGRDDAGTVTFAQFNDYAFSRNGILAIGAGVAAVVLVFSATYLRSPTWGANFSDAVALLGAMFAAFTAAATPITATGTDRDNPMTRVAEGDEASSRTRGGRQGGVADGS